MRNVFSHLCFWVLIFLLAFPVFSRGGEQDSQATSLSEDLKKQLVDIRWIAYAPTNFNPDPQHKLIPTDESIKADLEVLRNAGFDGLVTYGAELTTIPRIAEEVGFRGMLLGVWAPNNADELAKAKEAAKSDIVLAVIVGNEGLMSNRYDFATLKRAVEEMAEATGKPITTTEVVELYTTNKELLKLGSFLAPNAHPYHYSVKEPRQAVEWTVKTFKALQEHTDKIILLKEVGLPTAGDTGLSEEAQAEYYRLLKDTKVNFVYFEAFDGPWKQGGKVEPHWGLFRSDRSAKPVIKVLGFFLDVSHNFYPSGWMGDGERGEEFIEIDDYWSKEPHSPPTCYKWVYKPGGPKGWAAVAWQYPDSNWGNERGHDLTGYKRLTFWIKGEKGGEVVSIKAGGHTTGGARYPATFAASPASLRRITLKNTWEKKEIDLTGKDLSNVPCAFVWSASLVDNRLGCTFYLDDIRYEK
ncbi:TPA: hypothetical protein EYP66_12225 [Candidatus Poribacteria bacterium]|nr:hypothetical protein [Candidatus Poribacteria bacterium]